MIQRQRRPENGRPSSVVPYENIVMLVASGRVASVSVGIKEHYVGAVHTVPLFMFLPLRYYGRSNYVDCFDHI